MDQMLEIDVHDMAHGGEAVGRHDGKAIFVAEQSPVNGFGFRSLPRRAPGLAPGWKK